MIEVLASGFLSTIQDAGRPAYQRFGVPVSGAMDADSLAIANLLAGNRPEEAAMEVTISGPSLRFSAANVFAIAGADFSPTLNGEPIENNRAYLAAAGSVLKLGAVREGCRAYIAFAGGLEIQPVMGSRSTYLKGKIGGLDGRALRAGDSIPFAAPVSSLPNMPWRFLGQNFGFPKTPHQVLRVIPGPQFDAFSEDGIQTFLSSVYTVTGENDRMGYRFSGPAIAHKEGRDGNIISDGIPMGAIQVPQDQPIVLMADRQTTGGYTKIASVISVDLPRLAQLKTGDTVEFQMTDIRTAQECYRKRARFYKDLYRQFNERDLLSAHIYRVGMPEKIFHVTLHEYK